MTVVALVKFPPAGLMTGVARKIAVPKTETAYCAPTYTLPPAMTGGTIFTAGPGLSRERFWLELYNSRATFVAL